MVRWEPGARGRLQEAALRLFLQQGFDQTTTAEIAASVGLTERTFFRHFADKREVLFAGQDEFEQLFLDGVQTAAAGASAMQVVTTAFEYGAARFFPDERRAHARARQRVIDAHPALEEREQLKLAHLARALTGALHERGHADPAARLAAETAMMIFGIAFGSWLADGETRSLVTIQRDVAAELTTMIDAAAGSAA